MISRTKRNIYIAVIGFCIVASLIIIFFFRSSVPQLPGELTLSRQQASKPASQDLSSPPRIFPLQTQFDLSVFNSPKFINLKETQPLSVEETELGKDDPFKP